MGELLQDKAMHAAKEDWFARFNKLDKHAAKFLAVSFSKMTILVFNRLLAAVRPQEQHRALAEGNGVFHVIFVEIGRRVSV